jgi:hypothetical protein
MSDIRNKTVGELIDQLITASLHCWHRQEIVMSPNTTKEEAGEAAIELQKANARRTKLIQAINLELGGEESPLSKTYV